MPPSIDKDSSCRSPSNEQNDHYKLPKGNVSDEQNASAKTEGMLFFSRVLVLLFACDVCILTGLLL